MTTKTRKKLLVLESESWNKITVCKILVLSIVSWEGNTPRVFANVLKKGIQVSEFELHYDTAYLPNKWLIFTNTDLIQGWFSH